MTQRPSRDAPYGGFEVFGHTYRCTRCEFVFCSGWSHHEGGQLLVGRACAAHFVLGGGKSCWGTEDGELLQLLAEHGDGPATGIQVRVRDAEPSPDEQWDGVSRLVFDDVPCPRCGRAALTQSLKLGEECPECHVGRIEGGGTCIY